MRLSSIAAALCSAAGFVSALDPIEAVGNKLFRKDGSQFFIKGIAYQLRPADPLIDTEQCKRDASLMKELGTNAIRVYHVDPSAHHDGCMAAFADAGIYVFADLDTFDTYILPGNLHWNHSQYDRYAQVMDAFHQYDNVLGFFVGNENIARKEDSPAAPFIKAAARDMKTYRDSKGYRNFLVGYSGADIAQLRPMLQDYLTCGGNSSETIDFYGLNSYSWCDPSDPKTSGYDQLEVFASNFPVPIFISETGCNVPGPRKFDDQDAIFGSNMNKDWSGAMIYEWIQEENNYGLITYGPKTDVASPDVEGGFLRKGNPTPKNPDFEALKTKWSNLHPTGVKKADYDPSSVSTRDCPKSTQGGWWEVNGNVPLPKLGDSGPAVGGPSPETTQIGANAATKTVLTSGESATATATGAADSGASGTGSNANVVLGVIGASFAGTLTVVAFLL